MYGIAIVRFISFLFLDDFVENADISVAIKSGSTVTLNTMHCRYTISLESTKGQVCNSSALWD